jgi:CrcB protein
MLQNVVVVGIGAAIGANLRYLLGLWAVARWGQSFPYGTMLINIVGSLLIGFCLMRLPLDPRWRLGVITGLLGGFTTFSTFSYEALALVELGRWQAATLYIGGSVGLGLLAAAVGLWLGRA